MRILFFMPLAGRTGSEVALFNLILRAAARGWEVGVACPTRGELLGELPPRVPVYVREEWGTLRRVYASARRRLGDSGDKFLTWAHAEFRPEVWYVNTIIQPGVIREAEAAGVPCVLHVHELEQIFDRVAPDAAEAMMRYPRLVVACSETAREVCRVMGREGALEVCYETIDPRQINWTEEGARRVRASLGAGPQTFVWAMTGTLDPNKNPLRFAECAAALAAEGEDVRFLWAGKSEMAYGLYVRRKVEEMGLDGRVHFVGERTHDYYDHLAAADGLCVTSFKESFSLAAAEAAHLGKPVVSFNCGGVAEIVREGMGVVIDSWNTSDLVSAMRAVMRGEVGFDAARSRERVREFYVDVQGARWENFLRQHFGGEAVR